MKLSIVIPVYNAEPFLKRCFDSIRIEGKHLKDVEVIVVDDGSTDGSSEICDEYEGLTRHGFAVKIIHKKNGGCCSARNEGMCQARGEYIANLDADDELVDGAVELMLNAIENPLKPDIIQFGFYKHQDGADKLISPSFARTVPLPLVPSWWVLVWNKLYKRSFIGKNNLRYLEGLNYDDDAHFNLQCFRYNPLFTVRPEPIVRHHYDNEGSITHTLNKDKFINATIATAELLREDNPPEVERLIRERIVKKWTSKQYIEAFGGDE